MGTILVALDGSPRGQAVLRTAIDYARRLGHRLWLFRAVGVPAELPAEAYAVPPDRLGALLVDRAERDLDRLAGDLPPGLLAGRSAELGIAWDSIVRVGSALNVELIVIGAHGYRLADRVLGTTAAKVVNHADRPVLVVR